MHLRDRSIIISKKPLKENCYLITVFTENHGIYSGIIKCGKKNIYALSEGNLVDFLWSARLSEHIGSVKIELIKAYYIHIVSDKTKLYAFNAIIALIKKAFQERESRGEFYNILLHFISNLNQEFSIREYIELELALLKESGYGLQLRRCVVTGSENNLSYISPKSGNAVCYEIGKEYSTKLLKLPLFLVYDENASKADVNDAFIMTSYFLYRYILQNKELKVRDLFIRHVTETWSKNE